MVVLDADAVAGIDQADTPSTTMSTRLEQRIAMAFFDCMSLLLARPGYRTGSGTSSTLTSRPPPGGTSTS